MPELQKQLASVGESSRILQTAQNMSEASDQTEVNRTRNLTSEPSGVLGQIREDSGWDVYNNEAKKVDTELVKDWSTSLNFLLLFAAIFATVLTAFIVESKKLLEEDPMRLMADIMLFFANKDSNGTDVVYDHSPFQPTTSAIAVNCFFFASLSASLVAALASVIALQWVADYDAAISRGGSSPEDRAKRRQFRHAGVVWWRMGDIIAALPLLLYSSVFSFFSGVILWVWIINRMVGLVLVGGAICAFLFYGLSTFLAVACVSAPFRTPLSRWIYSLSQLTISGIYKVGYIFRPMAIPHSLERRHTMSTRSHKREDREVENRGQLGRDALVWLANQLHLSQDHDRHFLLLLKDVSILEPQYLPSFAATEAPWSSIFDLLGWRYLSGSSLHQKLEESFGMATLQRCSTIPAVQSLISSGKRRYSPCVQDPRYWSQYCNMASKVSWSPDYDGPNRLWLLQRDLPQASGSSHELEAALLFSRWRNSVSKQPQLLEAIFRPTTPVSSKFLTSCITVFSEYILCYRKCISLDGENGISLTSILCEATKAVMERNDIHYNTTSSLLHTYSSLLIGSRWDDGSYISTPLLYGRELRRRPAKEHSLHESMILLLAKQLGSHFPASLPLRVQEIIAMLWVRVCNPVSGRWYTIVDGREDNFYAKVYGSFSLDWIPQAEKIPRIMEILIFLAKAQAANPRVGPLWRAARPNEGNNPRFAEALHTFDELVKPNSTPVDHGILVNLVCQDLELKQKPEFEEYTTELQLSTFYHLRDPCLRFLSNFSCGDGRLDDGALIDRSDPLREASWDRIERCLFGHYMADQANPVLIMKAALWPTFKDKTSLCARAMREPNVFLQLENIFRNPIGCEECEDGPGHFFFHLLEGISLVPFRGRDVLFGTIILHGLLLPLRITTLFRASTFKESSEYRIINENLRGITPMNKVLREISSSQSLLLSFIWSITRGYEMEAKKSTRFAEELAVVLHSTNKALDWPYEEGSGWLLPLLSRRLRHLGGMLHVRCGLIQEAEVASIEAEKTAQQLMALWATRSVFGRINSRLLVCTRSGRNARVTSNELLLYDE